MSIFIDQVNENHPLVSSLQASDVITESGVPHRELLDKEDNNALIDYFIPILQYHHISNDALKRHKELVQSLRISNLPELPSPYPHNLITQKGNFAEIFLAEYLSITTKTQLPIYRLRYNPNPDQSMKGDDVLLFDLDSSPVKIIIGESKFRGTPDKKSVIEIVDGLLRSKKAGLPTSLMFVADRLFEENKPEIGKKVQECALLFANNNLHIDYVGMLMSNQDAKNAVNKHTSNNLHNLLMISLGMQNPENVVKQAFAGLEASL